MAELQEDSLWEYWEVAPDGDWRQAAPRHPTNFGRWTIHKVPSEAAAAFDKVMHAALTGQLKGVVAVKRALQPKNIGGGLKAEKLSITVYTTKDSVDIVGIKLARLLQIHYKVQLSVRRNRINQ